MFRVLQKCRYRGTFFKWACCKVCKGILLKNYKWFLSPVFIYIIANPVSLHFLPYYAPKTHIVPVKGLFRTKCWNNFIMDELDWAEKDDYDIIVSIRISTLIPILYEGHSYGIQAFLSDSCYGSKKNSS